MGSSYLIGRSDDHTRNHYYITQLLERENVPYPVERFCSHLSQVFKRALQLSYDFAMKFRHQ